MGESSLVKASVFLTNATPVHRVHNQGVTVANESDHLVDLGPHRVLAGCRVDEDTIRGDPVGLANGVPLDGADRDVADRC